MHSGGLPQRRFPRWVTTTTTATPICWTFQLKTLIGPIRSRPNGLRPSSGELALRLLSDLYAQEGLLSDLYAIIITSILFAMGVAVARVRYRELKATA